MAERAMGAAQVEREGRGSSRIPADSREQPVVFRR